MNEKKSWFLFIGIIVLIIASFFGGYFISRGRSDYEIRDAQNTIDELTKKFTKLDNDFEIAESEINTLRELQSRDKQAIENLSKSNRAITGLVEQQRNLINQLKKQSTEIEGSSDSITNGLGNAINSVEEIIQYIQTEKN
ncbi:MAG: hypothetical protein ACTSPI_00290 [Candidatus Heimdallarchaeaceae archaeon]